MNYTVKELRQLLDAKKISVKELLDGYFAEIEKKNPIYNAYIIVTKEQAYKQADYAQKLIDDGKAKALTGIPMAIKDNIMTKGILTTCASQMLKDYIPVFDATAIRKLYEEGAVIIGKTNLDEFGMGCQSKNSYFGKTLNPLNTDYIPGGSSGGSAAAVAGGLAAAALGSDTGGSIRQPAVCCGLVGLRPTYGRVSRFGLAAYASSFDQISPIAKTAEDCGLILNAIAGKDALDMTSASAPAEDFTSAIGQSMQGKTIALVKEFLEEETDEEVKESVLAAANIFKKMGCGIKEVSIPDIKYAAGAYYIISSAEVSSNLARFDGIKFGYRSEDGDTYKENIKFTRNQGFGWEAKRRTMLGLYCLSSGNFEDYYNKAMLIKTKIKQEFQKALAECDFIISPVMPVKVFKTDSYDTTKLYKKDIFTVSAALAGLPAISVPCGIDSNGMPIGLQIIAKEFAEKDLIAACSAFEKQYEKREA